MPPSRFLYSCIAYPLAPYALWRAAKRGGLAYWREYFGFSPITRGAQAPIWIHAVSLGEAAAAGGLIDELHRRGYSLLLTHTTAAGREYWQKQYGDKAAVCALPFDLIGATRRFVRRARPALAVIMEAEYWPNLLAAADAQGAKIVLANARLGGKNARRYARAGRLMFELTRRFDAIGAQTRADQKRLSFFGARNVVRAGNLKFDRAPGAPSSGQTFDGGKIPAAKTALLIAGTRQGEEKKILAAADGEFWRRFFVILAPRHPQRGDEIADLLAKKNIAYRRRTRDETIDLDTKLYLADTLGEMDLFYAVCDIALIGGSFLPYGGQNPIEAMAAGKTAVIGPHSDNYRALVNEAVKAGALFQADDPAAAMEKIRALADDTALRNATATAAMQLCKKHQGALQKHLALLEPFLPRLTGV